MTSQPGSQTVASKLLANISRNKDNQELKLTQVIEYHREIFFFRNNAEDETGRLVRDIFLFF